jgi:8-oxo-dGTP pyrophosphatase MutT (NUDIX family)
VVGIREAATVVLLRDGPSGLQTWLLRRVPKMAFAAGMSVFPGGAVDAADALDGHNGSAAALRAIADQLSTTAEHAGRLVCAAIRETFEEVGVLLVQPPAVLSATERVAVEQREKPFADVLTGHGLELDLDAVRPWARWITPEGEVRRYDTYFFVALVPDETVAAAVTSEASHADWIPVDQALAESGRGARPMLPPTIVTLTEVAQYPTAAEVLAAAAQRRIQPVRPSFVRDSDGNLSVDLGNGTRLPLPADFIGASGTPPR